MVFMSMDSSPPALRFHYTNTSAFQGDYRQYLCHDALFVSRKKELPAKGTEMMVNITLPNGASIDTTGRVEVVLPTGLGLSLRLDRAAHKLLEMALKAL